MKILISKLKKYGLYSEFEKSIPKYYMKKIDNCINIPFYNIVEYVNLKKIRYNYDDFLEDYASELKNKTEKYLLWQIWKKGYSINSFIIKNNISTALDRHLRYGIDNNSTFKNQSLVVELWKPKLDLKIFKVTTFETHIELHGKKELLENFRELHKIKYEVLWDQTENSYHLAFGGILAEYIKKNQA